MSKSELRRWLEATSPDREWGPPHLALIQDRLAAVERGECRRLLVSTPPRVGKSTLITIHFPVRQVERRPSTRVIIGCFSGDLAREFTSGGLRIAKQRGILLAKETESQWRTAAGGGVRATSVGTGVIGRGANGIVVDDPFGSRLQADSPAYRERVWRWWTDDLYQRLEPRGWVIVVMSRWGEDDLIGRLMNGPTAREWEHIRLPAIAEDGDPLGRQVGEAIWPERFTTTDYAQIRQEVGEREWWGKFQTAPFTPGGDLFDVTKFEIVAAAPAGLPSCRAWDFGYTAGGGDPTAGVRIDGPCERGWYYVTDVKTGRLGPTERDDLIVLTSAMEPDSHVEGPQDPAAGKQVAELFVQKLQGRSVSTHPVRGNKMLRADPFASQVNAGNVKLVKGVWNSHFVDELQAFPNGPHDDQVDAAADAFTYLALKAGRRGAGTVRSFLV